MVVILYRSVRARAIVKVAPHWLIFVEGTGDHTNDASDSSMYWVSIPTLDRGVLGMRGMVVPLPVNSVLLYFLAKPLGQLSFWGENLMAVRDYPVRLPRSKLVYSPHVYGPPVAHEMDYFGVDNFEEVMPKVWYYHFGYVKRELGYPVVIGEFGGVYGKDYMCKEFRKYIKDGKLPEKYVELDGKWQRLFVEWLKENGICDFFYWSWNPNSKDTCGLLRDDWKSIYCCKYCLLRELMEACRAQLPSVPPECRGECGSS